MPGLTLPNLEVETTHGKMRLHDYVGDSFAIIFSHPGDFTPVCTTDSLQRASKHRIATPANWKPGDLDARRMFPQGFSTAKLPSKKQYLRFTDVDH